MRDSPDRARIAPVPAEATVSTARDQLRFLLGEAAQGRRTALVTMTSHTGSTSRAVGTHVAVSESGASRGSLSAGCVEQAIVAEAMAAIAAGAPRQVRFGAGSPFIDIRLPCGGGIDLLILPDPDVEVLRRALQRLDQRSPVTLSLRRNSVDLAEAATTGWTGDAFLVRHLPTLRLMILGQGEEALALAALARSAGAEVVMLSPDEGLLAASEQFGAAAHRLATPAATAMIAADPWTAALFLFHDHDWEPQLLARVLAQPAFFIGAMGSRGTHETRLDRLREAGVAETALARIVSPLGLIPAARDPMTLAVSALAQVVERWREVAG